MCRCRAFLPSALSIHVHSVVCLCAGIVMQQANPMSSAVAEFAEKAPELASRGLGVTTNAERWNGRHAMFGMFLMTFTAYLKGHGLIPDADKVLDVNQWGPLAYAGMGQVITNERAIILVAHIHVLFVSIVCAFAPLSFQVASQTFPSPPAPPTHRPLQRRRPSVDAPAPPWAQARADAVMRAGQPGALDIIGQHDCTEWHADAPEA